MPNNIYPSQKVLPYVYYGIHKETGQFYHGYRSANTKPSHLDLGTHYFTSSKKVKELGFENFNWFILAEFFNYDTKGLDAYNFEQDLIYENWNNELKLNKYYDKEGRWSTLGMKHSQESLEKMKKPKSKEAIEKTASKKRGVPQSNETKNKISIATSGKNNPMYNHVYSEETLKKMKKPKTEKHKENISKTHSIKYFCPHCNKSGGRIMLRWHFDNCKFAG